MPLEIGNIVQRSSAPRSMEECSLTSIKAKHMYRHAPCIRQRAAKIKRSFGFGASEDFLVFLLSSIRAPRSEMAQSKWIAHSINNSPGAGRFRQQPFLIYMLILDLKFVQMDNYLYIVPSAIIHMYLLQLWKLSTTGTNLFEDIQQSRDSLEWA